MQLFETAWGHFRSKQSSDCRPDTYTTILPAQAVELMPIPKLVAEASALASPATSLPLLLGTGTAGYPTLPHPLAG